MLKRSPPPIHRIHRNASRLAVIPPTTNARKMPDDASKIKDIFRPRLLIKPSIHGVTRETRKEKELV